MKYLKIAFTFIFILNVASAKTTHKKVEVSIQEVMTTVTLSANQQMSNDDEIVHFSHLRAVIDGVKYPIFTHHGGSSLSWCNTLGFKYLNYSETGYLDKEYDNEEQGLYLNEEKIYLGAKKPIEGRPINSLSCTNNPKYQY
jgi:hypothetical protein